MSKIVGFIAGPFEDDEMIWNVCQVQYEDGSVESEEIFYDDFDDAYGDMCLLESGAEIDLEEDYIDEREIEDW